MTARTRLVVGSSGSGATRDRVRPHRWSHGLGQRERHDDREHLA